MYHPENLYQHHHNRDICAYVDSPTPGLTLLGILQPVRPVRGDGPRHGTTLFKRRDGARNLANSKRVRTPG